MSGDQWTARLSEFIDGELDQGEHEALERHLMECGDCRESVALLRRVRIRAGALGDRPPQADLWPGIAARIGVHADAMVAAPRSRRRWTFTVPQLAAAGLALLLAGGGTVWVGLGGMHGSAAPAANAPVLASVGRPGGVLVSGHAYDAAIADLEAVLARNRDRLDSATVQVLEESLRTIDRAIDRARLALEADPRDAYLNTHLAETMRRKLDLLRRAADFASVSL
ncbi:MAG TPA: zf-HC2 domain-containing protein [Gemmatimonadales bacterium]